MAELTERLRELRGDALQKDIAAVIGVKQSTYTLYEGGKREPGLDSIRKLAKYFHVSVDYLLGVTNVKADNINVQIISERTGLSPNAIKNLATLSNIPPDTNFSIHGIIAMLRDGENVIDEINRVLEDLEILGLIYLFFAYEENDSEGNIPAFANLHTNAILLEISARLRMLRENRSGGGADNATEE